MLDVPGLIDLNREGRRLVLANGRQDDYDPANGSVEPFTKDQSSGNGRT